MPSNSVDAVSTKALAVPDAAEAIIIIDGASYERGANVLKTIKGLRKEIEQTFDPIKKKAHAAWKETIAQQKKVEEPLIEAENILKPKIAAYLEDEARKRREEELRLQAMANAKAEEQALREAELAHAAGDTDEAERLISEPVDAAPVIVQKAMPKVDGVSTRKVARWKVQDRAQVSDKFLMLDEKAINALVRSLGKQAESIVGGITVWEETIVSSRAS